ncbi:JAB domain-containing protein [Clostridium butyricum]|uniref:JAB domain-containing protein n=1 Tax=Clostridium butyricum TaxID=1492 RepID=UPI00168B5F38|nr:JAB domain-containing protein [Clostridium butyricum]MDB2152503.1 JAB domain-containing protein [Clostridium butyricum]
MVSKDKSNKPLKRINVVSIKMIRESSVLYNIRRISKPKDIVDLGKKFLDELDREELIVACLNTKNEVNSVNVVSIGSLNNSVVHPREVFKAAILSNAASIVIIHNHPSGDATPSNEDKEITLRIKESGIILGIKLLDHIIIGNDVYYSFKEHDEV